MQSKYVFKSIIVAAIMIVAVVFISNHFKNQRTAIEADRAETVRQIEAEEAAIVQSQKTERTEERSQFWQKVVPWGSDEDEDNSNEVLSK